MKEKLRFLGLDVHAETIAAAIAEPELRDPVPASPTTIEPPLRRRPDDEFDAV